MIVRQRCLQHRLSHIHKLRLIHLVGGDARKKTHGVARLLEARLSPYPLFLCLDRLLTLAVIGLFGFALLAGDQQHADEGTDRDEQEHGQRRDRDGLVPPRPFHRFVPQGRRAGQNRLILQKSPQIFGKCTRGLVALGGFLGGRFGKNRLQLGGNGFVDGTWGFGLKNSDLPQKLLARLAGNGPLQGQ